MSNKPREASEKEDREIILTQYTLIRAEMLMLMAANESRVFSGIGVSGTMLGVLVSLTASKIHVPGIVFLLPVILMMVALNVHVLYAARVANMSTYWAEALRQAGASAVNWERDIGEFARTAQTNLSSRISVAIVYISMSTVAVVAGTASSLLAIGNIGLNPATVTDLALTVLLGLYLLGSMTRVKRLQAGLSTLRAEFETFWKRYFGPKGPKET